MERLLTPVLLYQNYHLVHHLHPLIPFYRYIAVWRRNESEYLSGDPELSTRPRAQADRGRVPPHARAPAPLTASVGPALP